MIFKKLLQFRQLRQRGAVEKLYCCSYKCSQVGTFFLSLVINAVKGTFIMRSYMAS